MTCLKKIIWRFFEESHAFLQLCCTFPSRIIEKAGQSVWESVVKRVLYIAACLTLTFAVSGCANRPFANQPVRTWLRGAICNTCNPAAGQPANCGTNVAPGCTSGVCSGVESPMGSTGGFAEPGAGIQFYGDPILNSTPSFGPSSQIYPSNEIYGGATGSPVTPPDVGPGN